MGRSVITKITCDRCGIEMASAYGKTWGKQKGRISKMTHDVPEWSKIDEFILCNECTDAFNRWMKEPKEE